MTVIGHTLGFPRIGINRELKKALEDYWQGKIHQKKLLEIGQILRIRHWEHQKNAGLDLIPVGDFAWYDHVLTTSLMVNNIPNRHKITHGNNTDIDTLFRISRGFSHEKISVSPSEMKKWFNTNYHYIVPEFTKNQKFQLNWKQLFHEIEEALSLKYPIKPILLGPISYLWLGKTQKEKFDKLLLLPSLLAVYQEILEILAQKNISWVQIEEPILVLELPELWKQAYLNVYRKLYKKDIKLLLTTYFDNIYHQLDIIKNLKIDGLHIDLTSSSYENISMLHETLPKHWVLSAGVINGRNVWKTNIYTWFQTLRPFLKKRNIWIGSSCSLLHVPIDLSAETLPNLNVQKNLAFALQKCSEIKTLCTALNDSMHNTSTAQYIVHNDYIKNNLQNYSNNNINPNLFKKNETIVNNRNSKYPDRCALHKKNFNLPLLPTTTIGSFPQTKELRELRLQFKNKKIDEQFYQHNIKNHIKKIIIEQEKLGLDVLVHGEPERNDMVEYFGENLNGFLFTKNGWVQSYGSRCVKPPIIFNDIHRTKPITVPWINYAQSLTKKPVKGILTGPITIMSWSFTREDIPRQEIALQLALAIRAEVLDLEKSGISIIQIDEPALREGLPLKQSEQKKYLEWATYSFKITVSSVKDSTQIHTHMCYAEFNDIIYAITQLDVDVISIETSRSEHHTLKTTIQNLIHNNINSIGPGVYDIHSSNIPTKQEIIDRINKILQYIPKERLWINPDCGLKTRSWKEIRKALSNITAAAKTLRTQYQSN